MTDPLFHCLADERDAGATDEQSLERTSSDAMSAMAFTLHWSSEHARHADCLVAPKLNLWRDILPPGMDADLMDRPVGHQVSRHYAEGGLVERYRDSDCLRAPDT